MFHQQLYITSFYRGKLSKVGKEYLVASVGRVASKGGEACMV